MSVSHSFCSYMHAFSGKNLNAIFPIFILSLSAILLLFNNYLLPLPPFTLASLKTRSHNFPERNEGRKPFYSPSHCAMCCAKSHLTLCNLPVSSVHGIFQARILEWATISSSRGTSWPRDQACVYPCLLHCRRNFFFNLWATKEALSSH